MGDVVTLVKSALDLGPNEEILFQVLLAALTTAGSVPDPKFVNEFADKLLPLLSNVSRKNLHLFKNARKNVAIYLTKNYIEKATYLAEQAAIAIGVQIHITAKGNHMLVEATD